MEAGVFLFKGAGYKNPENIVQDRAHPIHL